MRTSVKTLTVGSVLAATLLVTPSAFAAGTTATATVEGGSLAVTAAPSVALGAVTTSHSAQPLGGSVTVGVDDTTGTGDGWDVTQVVSAFAYTGDNEGTAIPAGNFAVTEVEDVTQVAGADANGADNVVVGAPGPLDVPRTVLSAEAGNGEGSYTAPVNVELTVPAGTRAGTYTATLTTTSNPDLGV